MENLTSILIKIMKLVVSGSKSCKEIIEWANEKDFEIPETCEFRDEFKETIE